MAALATGCDPDADLAADTPDLAFEVRSTDAHETPDTAPPSAPQVVSIAPSDAAGIGVPETGTAHTDLTFLSNHTDGFGLQPRISITLSAAVDPASFDDAAVRLVPDLGGEPIALMQRIVDTEALTIHALPRRYLAEGTTYRVEVTDALTAGGIAVTPASATFTTGHFTQTLAAIRAQLDASPPPDVTIELESSEALFEWTAHRATLPAGSTPTLPAGVGEDGGGLSLESTYAEAGGDPVELSAGELPDTWVSEQIPEGGGPVRVFQRYSRFLPDGVSAIRIGRFESPWYLTEERLLSTQPTAPLGTRTVWFTLWLPLGEAPAGGWPIVLYGNGYRSHRHHAAPIAGALASDGIATLAITAVGHGGGPEGWLTLAGMEAPDGGRAKDVDGDGWFGREEGMRADPTGPSGGGLRGLTDGVRQTVVDLMVAARVLGAGLPDIATGDDQRAYFGISNGGRVGALLLAVDPRVPVGVLNVPPSEAFVPLNDTWRPLWAAVFGGHDPPLLNNPHPTLGWFDEDIPARGDPVQLGLAPGADAIQRYLDRYRWATMPMNTAAYAKALEGKAVLVQVGRGDTAVVNPSTADLIREGGLAQSTCLVWPARSKWFDQLGALGQDLVHVFAFLPDGLANWHPGRIGAGARKQLVAWIASRGDVLVDPDPEDDLFGLGDVFEVPLSANSLELLDQSFGYQTE